MSKNATPELKHTYQTVFCDSTRWANFVPRSDDVIVATSYKAGTTWMQAICGALIYQSPEPPAPLDEISPWLDSMFEPIESVLSRIEAMEHRRYLKTHLPLTAIPYHENVRYIFVGRDGRDVWMSLWNHLNNMKPETIQALIENPKRRGYDLPPPAADINEGFDDWVSKSQFPWERDGYPAWSHHHHAQTWWDYRHLENILCVHFSDLLDDLDGQMRRISDYLGIAVNEAIWPSLVKSVTFDEMKRNSEKRAPGAAKGHWKDAKNFFHKGTNRRWENLLTPAQLTRYDKLITEVMEPGLVRWMKHEEGFLDPKLL